MRTNNLNIFTFLIFLITPPYISECEDYSNSTVDVVQAIALTPQSDPVTISVVKCNFNGLPLIVGGTPAVAGEFPFMVSSFYG